MLPKVSHFVGKAPERVEENQRYQIAPELRVNAAQIQHFRIQHQDIFRRTEPMQEGIGTIFQGPGAVAALQQNEGAVLVQNFERAVEELIGVDRLTVDDNISISTQIAKE